MFAIGTISAWMCKRNILYIAYWALVCGRSSCRHHFSLDVEEKHPIERVLGMALWEMFAVGTISAWMCKRSILYIAYWALVFGRSSCRHHFSLDV